MKSLKLLALVLILIGVVADASAHAFINRVGVFCADSPDTTLCNQTTGDDTGCEQFCASACSSVDRASCVIHINGGYLCKCWGDPR